MKKNLLARRAIFCLMMVYMAASCQPDEPVHNISDVESVYKYILKHDYLPGQEKKIPFEIAMQFLKSSGKNSNENRISIKRRLLTALALKNKPEIRKFLNVDCLSTPNTSIEIKILSQRLAFTKKEIYDNGEETSPVLLSFSTLCATADGRIYCYVELVAKSDHYASGNLYILNKGVVERVINIWIT